MIVKCLISYVTLWSLMLIFRPNGRLLWFLYNFKKKFPKKKFFQNFQKVELWNPIKGSRVIFEQKHFGIPPYYNPRAIQKKKKSWNFHHRFFSYWQLILKWKKWKAKVIIFRFPMYVCMYNLNNNHNNLRYKIELELIKIKQKFISLINRF
jgi:hypothetical protein